MTAPISSVAAHPASQPRIILVDDNIRTIGGHFFELAYLLLKGAQAMGYRPVMATHASFAEASAVPRGWTVMPTFGVRRMVRWSMGVDGKSNDRRSFDGRPVNETLLAHWRCRLSDALHPPAKRPSVMATRYREDLCGLLQRLRPTSDDVLLINTADDFAMLAVADAVSRLKLPPMRIDALFHFALVDSTTLNPEKRLKTIGQQLSASLARMRPHDVHLHATTESLASQLRRTDLGHVVDAIPYPTRTRKVTPSAHGGAIKVVLAGLPRAEKGRDAIAEVLSGIESSLLKPGIVQLSMQMPPERWESMVPPSLHRNYQHAVDATERGEPATGPLEIMTANLSTEVYHRWLDSADLGLFLYDADRYVARCSGVLLEMMARGVPVIVPDQCWLADQVRLAGGHRSIGLIYQHRSEIPELMRQFVQQRAAIEDRAVAHATTIATRHNAKNTLATMGLRTIEHSRRVA
jgi:hypothetical protein